MTHGPIPPDASRASVGQCEGSSEQRVHDEAHHRARSRNPGEFWGVPAQVIGL